MQEKLKIIFNASIPGVRYICINFACVDGCTAFKQPIKGCVSYFFASLFGKFKREHLSSKYSYFHFKSSFNSWNNQILTFSL